MAAPRRSDGYCLVELGYEDSIAFLRHRLGHAPPGTLEPTERQPELSFTWCSPRTGGMGSPEALGLHVALRLASGQVFVGDVIEVHDRVVVLEAWGCRGPMSIERASIIGVMVTEPHSYIEERAVCQRQARGLPALVLEPVTPRPPPPPRPPPSAYRAPAPPKSKAPSPPRRISAPPRSMLAFFGWR